MFFFVFFVSVFVWDVAIELKKNYHYKRLIIKYLYKTLGLQDPYKRNFQRKPKNDDFISLTIEGINNFFNNLGPGQKLTSPLFVISSLIFALWQFPNIVSTETMYRNFTHSPIAPLKRTLLTSALSHSSFYHFLFNMIALWSFVDISKEILGPEYLLATIVSGAIFSSFTQQIYSKYTSKVPSLGASGFLYTLVTIVALKYPDSQASLLFFIPSTLSNILIGLVAFDLIGLTGTWDKLFNLRLGHAAHLGGFLAGLTIWYLTQNNKKNKRKLSKF